MDRQPHSGQPMPFYVPSQGQQTPSLADALAAMQLQSPLNMQPVGPEPRYFTEASQPLGTLSRSNSFRSDASDLQPPPASYFAGGQPATPRREGGLVRSSSMRSTGSASGVVVVSVSDRPLSRSNSFRSAAGSSLHVRTSFRGQAVDALPTMIQAPRLPVWKYPIYDASASASASASAPAPAPASADIEDLANTLNDTFQAVLADDPGVHRVERLAKILAMFATSAQATVATIVAELSTPFAKKTIPPLVEGAFEYDYESVHYRMCVGEDANPGSESVAMKSASLELKSATALLSARIPGLYVPLSGVFTHYGYRFVATAKSSFVENDEASLIYGSLDGGCTVKNSDPVFDHLIRRVASVLNIKEHPIGASQTFYSLNGDAQGHIGRDGRYYVANTSRLYPPFPPDQQGSTSRFHKRMRPEFVLLSKVPLSSDSFSAWAVGVNRDVDNQTTAAFAELMKDDLIPRIAKSLDGYSSQSKDTDITSLLHRNGINMRYLASFLPHLQIQDSRIAICCEMLARWAREWMFTKLRKCRGDLMSVKVIASQCFNDILLREPHTQEFYSRVVRPGLLEKYGLDLQYQLEIDQNFTYKRMQALTGFKFAAKTLTGVVFRPADIIEVTPLSKTVRIRPFLVSQDLIDEGRLEEAEIILKKEIEGREQQAEENQYTIINLCRNLGRLSFLQGKIQEAETFYGRMLTLIKVFLGEESFDYKDGLESLANVYDQTQGGRGLDLHIQVVESLRPRLGYHPRLVTFMVSLANEFIKHRRPSDALRLAEDALKYHINGKSRLQYRIEALIHHVAARAHCDLDNIERTRQVLESCLVEVTSLYGRYCHEALPLLESLALVYKALNVSPQYGDTLQRALRIMQSRYGDFHPTTISTTDELIKVTQQNNDLDVVERLMNHALTIRETKYGATSMELAPYLNNLAIFYAESRKDANKALTLFNRVLAIRLQGLGQMNSLVASVMFNISNVLYTLRRFSESLQYSESALRIQEVVLGPTHPDVGLTLRSIASIYHDENRLPTAEHLLHRALSIVLSGFGPDHIETAEVYRSLALVCQDMNKLNEAATYAQSAHRIFVQTNGPESPETQDVAALLKKIESKATSPRK